jgi:hypothetical protein
MHHPLAIFEFDAFSGEQSQYIAGKLKPEVLTIM